MSTGNSRRTGARRAVYPLHPLGFALFPVLSLYAANVSEVPASDVLRPLALVLGTSLVAGMALRALLRDGRRAAVLLSGLLLLFFSYGLLKHVQPDLHDIVVIFAPTRASNINPHTYLLPLWGLSVVGVTLACARSRRDFAPITAVLNVVAVALVVPPLVSAGTYAAARHRNRTTAGVPPQSPVKVPSVATAPIVPATPAAPDIYYIVLDAYGRQDRLREFFGYDNEPFLRELEKRGFFVARKARANYVQTVLSLASSLNMTYLDEVARGATGHTNDLEPVSRMLDRSRVAAFLRARGYRHVTIPSDFPLAQVPSADISLIGSGDKAGGRLRLSPFEGLLLNTTPLAAIPHAERSLYDQHRQTINAAFDHLSGAPRLPGRKFVFVHIIAPHPPFVFGPNGEPIEPADRPFTLGDASDFTRRSGRDEYRRGYVGQVQYVNRRILAAIDHVLARSQTRPVIILQGDHGSRMTMDWKDIRRSNLREPFANLSAFYLPGEKADKVFYDQISPVNVFRLLFDHYFNTQFERLPDRSYYSPLQRPLDFTDVTDQIS